jgi:hypothetical protein
MRIFSSKLNKVNYNLGTLPCHTTTVRENFLAEILKKQFDDRNFKPWRAFKLNKKTSRISKHEISLLFPLIWVEFYCLDPDPICMESHNCGKLNPERHKSDKPDQDQDPHQSQKVDPDPNPN